MFLLDTTLPKRSDIPPKKQSHKRKKSMALLFCLPETVSITRTSQKTGTPQGLLTCTGGPSELALTPRVSMPFLSFSTNI